MSRVKHNAVHQFAAGLNNAPTGGPNLLPFPTPGQQGWKWLYQDFTHGVLWSADNVEYESTILGSTPAPVPGANGMLLPTIATDNTGSHIQDTTPLVIVGPATKRFYLETSVTLTAATMASNEFFIGFATDVTGTNHQADNGLAWGADAMLGFGKLDTATEVDFIARAADVEQTIGLGSTMTTAVRALLGCYYDGSKYFVYKDNVLVGEASQEEIPQTVMGISAFIKSGTAAVQSLLVNYVALGTEL